MNKQTEFYLGRLRSADAVNIIYQIIILLILLTHYGRIQYAGLFVLLHIAVILFLWRLPSMPSRKLLNWLRLWNPLITVPLNFLELHYLVHTVRPQDMDTLLIKIDHALFGVHPTVWLERISFPALTEYLQIVYSTFYFIPLVLALLLYFKNRMEEFDFFTFIMVYGFYLSYLLYFIVPAIGPRFSLAHLQTEPVRGIFFTELIRHTLNTLENIQRDCFPSGHTAMTFLTLFYARRFHKKYYYILLVIGTSLIFSTVYLRYHYVIDVIGGLAMAALVILTAPYLHGKLQKTFGNARPIATRSGKMSG